jgi:hypothetical protein
MPVLRVDFEDPTNPQVSSAQCLRALGPGLPIEISQATSAQQTVPRPPTLQPALALIDTGATHSCVDEQLAQSLNLPIIDQQQVTGVAGPQAHNVYLAQLSMPPPLGAGYRGRLIGVQLGGPCRVIVGRDFLARAIMIYDGLNGTVTISI